MSQLHIIIVTPFVISAIGCSPAAPINKPTTPIHDPSIPPPPREFEPTVAIDNAVLELVLSDIRTEEIPGITPFSLPRETPREIYFCPVPTDSVLQPRKPLESNELWSTMTDSESRLTQEAIKHLEERHAAGDSFHEFQVSSNGIHIIEAAPGPYASAEDVPYGALYPIRAWAPGYSHDGSYVVVHLYFPELFHPSYATYVLMSTNETWTIASRGFITYP